MQGGRASASSSPASSISCGPRSASRPCACWKPPAARSTCRAAQTCCGQPAYNSGDARSAKALALQTIAAFEGFDYVVAPSGSCAAMLKLHYPRLMAGDAEAEARARAFAERVHELVSFLVDVRGMSSVPGTFAGRVTYHDGCSGLRELEHQAPAAPAARRRRRASSCRDGRDARPAAASAGCSRSSFPTSPTRMVSAKTANIAAAEPELRAVGRARLPDQHRRQAVAAKARASAAGMSPRCSPARWASRRSRSRHASARHEAGAPAFEAGRRRRARRRAAAAGARRRSGRLRRRRARGSRRRCPSSRRCGASGRDIRDHTLAASRPLPRGVRAQRRPPPARSVHWAPTGADACDIILGICRAAGARIVTKSKSMVSEEIGLDARLEAAALEVVETDLGEYIIQIRGETPSHIIAPAIHLRAGRRRRRFPPPPRPSAADRDLSSPEALVARGARRAAREVPRRRRRHHGRQLPRRRDRLGHRRHQRGQRRPDAVAAARCTSCWPRSRRWCRRSTTRGRCCGCWRARRRARSSPPTRRSSPARAAPGDPDGPEACHVVLVDNGRSELLGSELREVLRCIRCGACMNHCPVYCAVGGHAYGSVYAGPDRRGADAGAGRARGGGRAGAGLDLLRPLRGGVPGRDPARSADAPLAGGGVRRAGRRGAAARCCAPGRSSRSGRALYHAAARWRTARARRARARRAAPSRACRSPGAGRATATCRRRRARTFQELWARRQREAAP